MDSWAHKVTYLKIKVSGALGLPPDDDRDPGDEQQQQSHCCEHGVSREHLLGHRARIRLRIISRRTAGVKVEEYRLDPEDKDVRTSGHKPPQAAHLRKGHYISKVPPQLPKTQNPTLSCQVQKYNQREVPLLTKQEGTSIDNLARFPGGDGGDRVTQTLQNV